MSDIDKIRRDVSLPATAQAFGVALVENGHEFEGCCPFHEERTPSFTLFAGSKDSVWRFQCFGCGAAGDVIDFVEKIQGVTKAEAIKILNGDRDKGHNIAPAQIEARDPYQGITPLDPPEELVSGRKISLYNPKREQNGNITPSMVFPYFKDGALIGYVLRHDLPDGKKETPQVQWVRLPDGRECWCRLPFGKPRPLYALERIGPETKQVFIVEGEKCADVFNQITGRVAVSWPGGTNGVRHCDWSALRGMDIVIWPDFDKPGFSAARDVTAALNGIARRVRFIDFGLGVRRERDDF